MRRDRPGPRPYTRLRTNPHFVAGIRASPLPYGPLALACGCREGHFSYLLNAVLIPGSPQNIDVLLRAADAIKFPRPQVFLDDPPAEPQPAEPQPVAPTPELTAGERAAERLERARARVAKLEVEVRELQTSKVVAR